MASGEQFGISFKGTVKKPFYGNKGDFGNFSMGKREHWTPGGPP